MPVMLSSQASPAGGSRILASQLHTPTSPLSAAVSRQPATFASTLPCIPIAKRSDPRIHMLHDISSSRSMSFDFRVKLGFPR